MWGNSVAATAAAFAVVGPARRVLVAGAGAPLTHRSPTVDTAVALSAAAGVAVSAVGVATGGYRPFFHEPLAILAVVVAGRAVKGRLRRPASSAADALAAVAPSAALRRAGPPGGKGEGGGGMTHPSRPTPVGRATGCWCPRARGCSWT